MYNYFYNNVVDFNNAINSYWPQSENPVTEDADNITGKDDLSLLPAEILTEMMMYLPLEDVQALSLTNHKISPTTEPVIQFKSNLKIQELFETFDSDSFIAKRKFKPEMLEIFKADIERAKTFQTGSNERLQALRNAICSLYQGKISLETLLCPFSFLKIFRDQPLVAQLMKGLIFNLNRCNFTYNYDKATSYETFKSNRFYNEKINHNGINSEILFLNLLKTNQSNPKELDIQIFNVTFVPKELTEALADALRENQSINKVCISWQDCDLVQLDAILEAIKNNERILKFEIRDIGSNRNCSGVEWSWEKTTKEKSYKEFEDLIKNKLSSTFQIQEPDDYGFFRCQKLPV